MDQDVLKLIQHKGCDVCIVECEKPVLLSICGEKFKGHKECMTLVEHRLLKYATNTRHSIRWKNLIKGLNL